MALTYKVLGQLNPSATTETTLYTCPTYTQAIISNIVVANQGALPATIRIAVRPNADTLEAKHYIVYGATLVAYETKEFALGVTIDAADIITVYASTSTMSFNAFGVQIV
jgi:hypothetical protein